MSCAEPIDFAVLSDYSIGALAAAEEAAVEEHLFACPTCCARLEQAIALADGVRTVTAQGNLLTVVPDELLASIAAEGKHIREYAPPRGGSVQCTVSVTDDFLIGRLNADLSAVGRLDLSLCDLSGQEKLRLNDIPFRPQAGNIVFQQPIDYAKAAPNDALLARLLEVDDRGEEHLLGEYTFIHTRTIPGPPGW